MGEARLHVVFGTGQVGSALAAHLAGLGIPVRAVSRHRPPVLAGGLTGGPPPVILVATISGKSLAVTTGIAAGVLLLGTAAGGFHDLARLRPARASSPAGLSAKDR